MASGLLVRMLLYTGVNRYLEFKVVDGSHVFKGGKVHKVPATDTEVISSGLMGFWEKRRMRDLLVYSIHYEKDKPDTHQGRDLSKMTTAELFQAYKLGEDTVDFVGHALCLNTTDEYLNEPAIKTVERINLYVESKLRYDGKSPYIYPMYGLGELPQAFARLSAIYGGTYMLDKPVDKLVYDESGRVCGVTSGEETVKCSAVICDPSYVPEKVKKVGQVVRCICFLSNPIPHTDNHPACQIIIPQKQVGRHNDIYISCMSASHNVVPKGKYLALVSTTVETADPKKELDPGFALLGTIDERFFSVSDVYEPLTDGKKDGVFISTSYDATSHFETSCLDILSLYERYNGKPLDLSAKNPALLGQEEE